MLYTTKSLIAHYLLKPIGAAGGGRDSGGERERIGEAKKEEEERVKGRGRWTRIVEGKSRELKSRVEGKSLENWERRVEREEGKGKDTRKGESKKKIGRVGKGKMEQG